MSKKQEPLDDAAARKKMMEGVPRINIGALIMPAIWGPVNGIWPTILYYPLWLLADNLFYSVYEAPDALNIVLSIVVLVFIVVVTLIFSQHAQEYACARYIKLGHTKEQYLKRERVLAVVMIIIAIITVAAATYYNLTIRPYINL